MEKIIKQGRLLFGIAITAFGVENLICARFGLAVRGVPWFPGNPFLAYLTGIALLAAGLSIAANVRARLTATLLGILFLLYVLLLEVSQVAAKPMSVSVRSAVLDQQSCQSSAKPEVARRIQMFLRRAPATECAYRMHTLDRAQ